MSMNVNGMIAAYGNYQNSYKTGSADKKKDTSPTKEAAQTKEATQTVESKNDQKASIESIGEKNLSSAAQKLLKDLRGSRSDMDFMVADFAHGDSAEDILAQSDKEFTVIFSKEEMERMASDPKYYAEKMNGIDGALRMSDEINAQFGFERAFDKTKGTEGNTDFDAQITKFGISFNSDGSTTFFAQLEKAADNQKEYLEKIQDKKAAEKDKARKNEQSKQTGVKKTTVQAASKDELLKKIDQIDWTLSTLWQRLIKELIFQSEMVTDPQWNADYKYAILHGGRTYDKWNI